MAEIGDVWAADTWVVDSWAADTWAAAVSGVAFVAFETLEAKPIGRAYNSKLTTRAYDVKPIIREIDAGQ